MARQKIFVICSSLIAIFLLLFGSIPAFAGGNSLPPGKSALGHARADLEQKLAAVPGFAGIAHSEETGQIIVFLENAQAKGNIPDAYEGFPVRKEVTGPFKALGIQVSEAPAVDQTTQGIINRLGSVRPLIGGVSVSALAGSRYIYAGTLGMVTYNDKILSNAHVLAMNPDDNSFISKGTTVVQPGTLDGGFTSANRVGQLENYIPIVFSSYFRPVNNYADAAIASIDSGISKTAGAELNAANDGTYLVSGTTTVSFGDTVEKSGRTTGWSQNTVASTNASTWIDYGSGKKAYFTDQILVNEPFIDSGDSGSCVDKDGEFVGLAFAGSSSIAIVCKASYIIDGLGIAVSPTTPDFSISASPSTVSFNAGRSATFNVSIIPSGGFNNTVKLTASSPAGIIVDPPTTTVSSAYAPTTFTVESPAPDTYTVTVTGTSGSLSHTASVKVTVNSTSGPALSVSVSKDKGSYKVGQTANITVSVTSGGSPVSGAAVNLSIIRPNGQTVPTQTKTTSSGGTAQFTWNTTGASSGTYTALADADLSGYVPGSGSTTFKIR